MQECVHATVTGSRHGTTTTAKDGAKRQRKDAFWAAADDYSVRKRTSLSLSLVPVCERFSLPKKSLLLFVAMNDPSLFVS